MNNKNFFAGLEELFARLASFILVVLGFVIFMIARDRIFEFNWLVLLQVLGLFWVLYEFLGLIFFQAFHFFAKQQTPQVISSQEESVKTPEKLQNLDKEEDKTSVIDA